MGSNPVGALWTTSSCSSTFSELYFAVKKKKLTGGESKAPSTRIRIRLKTQLFFSLFKTNLCVFASFSPAHTFTMNRFENHNPTAHA